MKDKIKEHIGSAAQLEKLYRADNKRFRTAFFGIYHEIAGHEISKFWKTRLEFDTTNEIIVQTRKTDILFLVIASVIAGLLIEIPQLFRMDQEAYFFYEKNAGLIVFLGLSLYVFLIRGTIKTKQMLITLSVFILSAVYINLLPSIRESDSITLAYIHLPLMLWCLYGLVFIDFDLRDKNKRMDYIKHNGDLAILIALILIAGGMLAGVTVGLFEAIDLKIEQFYFDYIVLWGLASVPIIGTFVLRRYPFVANKMAPIIATIFSPLVLITLVIYLISILVTGKDPYNNRDFLIVFNLMLLGVMGIVVFSISESSINKKQRFNEITLFALSIVTLIIDLVALSAILYRLGEYGFTPNRIAVLGSNLLIFGNLVLIMVDLYRVSFRHQGLKQVELTIAGYLPVYALWTVIVVFGFPAIFALK